MMTEIRWLRAAILEIDITSFFSAEGGPIWIKFRRLVQNDMLTAVIWSKLKPYFIFLVFLMQFGLWRTAAFVLSPIHLYRYRQVLGVCQDFSARWRTGGAGPGPGTGFLHFSGISEEVMDGFWWNFNFMRRRLLKNACMDLHEMNPGPDDIGPKLVKENALFLIDH